MPIYEYRCQSCAHVFEEWTQHFDSPSSETCPRCGQTADRIMSNTSFMLKGGGWYVTEYGSHKGKSEGGPAAAPDAHHDGNASKPAESAGASKNESGSGAGKADTSSAAASAPAQNAGQ